MALTSQEKDNLIRWDGIKKPFYEVYYLKGNDLSQGIAFWLRYTLLISTEKPPEASLWGIFFDSKNPENNFGIKQTFPIRETRREKDIFYFSIGDSSIFDRGAHGHLQDTKNQMSWELKFLNEGEGLSLRHFPSPLYWGGFPKTKFLAPYLSTKMSGELVVNGHRYELNQVPGHQAHIWGTEQAASWVWGNCNTFVEDHDFCFEGLSARVSLGEKPSPPMTLLFFYWEGKLHRLNSPVHWITNRSSYEFYQRQRRVEGETPAALPMEGLPCSALASARQAGGQGATRAPIIDRWHFEAASRELRFVGDMYCQPEDMAGVRYDDPTGSERYCHNTKVADLKIQIFKKQAYGWDCVQTLNASKSAAFEVVQGTLDPRVRLLIP